MATIQSFVHLLAWVSFIWSPGIAHSLSPPVVDSPHAKQFSPINKFLMQSYYDRYTNLHDSDFENFVSQEITSGLCEHDLVWRLSDLKRNLTGEGSHRSVSTLIKFQSQQLKSLSELLSHSCELIIIERLPSGVFADPFELQHFVQRGVFSDIAVFGDTNLELPSFLSNRSAVEIHLVVDPNILQDPTDIKTELPLHARYQSLNESGYSTVEFGAPDMLVRCSTKDKVENRCFLKLEKDKPGANPEKVKLQLASEGLLLEEMGGDVQVVEVSATEKIGLDNLEEALLLQADMMDLKARIDGPAQAYVVEARLDKGRGPLVTTIVKAGTLVCGQHVVVGSQWGRIRAIKDTAGKLTQRATPAMPVEIEGLRGLPMAGDDVIVVHSEERARMLSSGRQKKYEENRLRNKMIQDKPTTSDDSMEVPLRVEMPVIVKADVQGTVQAVTDALKTLNSAQVLVNVVHVGVGPLSQSDVDLAQACGACIVGFNVKSPPTALTQAATRASIKIILHRVIYHLLEDIGNLIIEKAPGTSETQVAGQAEVLNIFEIKGSKSKGPDVKIAGCRVIDGSVTRSATMRLLRSGEVVFEGNCSSLKREKQDVDTVKKGSECGLVISNWYDFQVGDVIQCLEQVVRKPKFIKSESGAVRIEC